VKYASKAPRVELLVRIIYAIIYFIASIIIGILCGIAWVLQLFVILITGTRNKTLHDVLFFCVKYLYNFHAYLSFVTDERPPVIPEGE